MKARNLLAQAPRNVLTNVWEVALLALTFAFVFTLSFWTMVVWQLATVLYLVAGFLAVRYNVTADSARARKNASRRGASSGALRVLSWALPLGASGAGMISVVLILYSRTTTGLSADDRLWVTVISAGSIFLSWMLLHTGFARVYEAAQYRSRGKAALKFPNEADPRLIDFLYFSFTIGTSFAASDTIVATQRMRLTVLIHSVASFFYNAVVVAMAIQVLQSLGAAGR